MSATRSRPCAAGCRGRDGVDPGNYHLTTVRFIGDVDDAIAHEIAASMRVYVLNADGWIARLWTV